ncbi:helix-turn-helix domain-containing protein [Halovivax gelatinilyticus]|uniref:helix-turn-helix domain-containing protein n=1 Tax=Halovivax gelatinilyticus TaxID=2961597 RepID=UPI0020CA2B01|nr:helix-turn-helix domain-containing protein [Halovivax gelatinilyticus]
MTEDELDAETAFSLLADETRVAIVRELGAATASPETGIPHLSYAELQARVDIRDSGRFNYHLTKLLGNYVAKESDGYRLRWPGMVLYRTLVAGLLTEEASALDDTSVGTDCHRCGEPIEISLYETLVRVRCRACDATYTDIYLPSHGLTDRGVEDLVPAVHRRSRTILGAMTAGQCPWCARAVSPDVHDGGPLPSHHDTRDLDAYAVYHCTDCTGFQYAPVSQVLCFEPVAIAFYHDRGYDLTAIPAWELGWAVTDRTTDVLERDPWRFSVCVPLDGEELVVELDQRLDVVDSTVRP